MISWRACITSLTYKNKQNTNINTINRSQRMFFCNDISNYNPKDFLMCDSSSKYRVQCANEWKEFTFTTRAHPQTNTSLTKGEESWRIKMPTWAHMECHIGGYTNFDIYPLNNCKESQNEDLKTQLWFAGIYECALWMASYLKQKYLKSYNMWLEKN